MMGFKLDRFTVLYNMQGEINERHFERKSMLQSSECPFEPFLYPTPEEFKKGITAMPFAERVSKSIRDRREREQNSE